MIQNTFAVNKVVNLHVINNFYCMISFKHTINTEKKILFYACLLCRLMQEYRGNVVQPNGTAQPFFEGKRMFL